MRALLIPTTLLLLASSLEAQYTPPLDAKTMLYNLDQLQSKQAKTAASQRAQALSDFTAASQDDVSALNFYMQAVYVTRYQGQPQEQTNFNNWKRQMTSGNKLSPFAIRTCLMYMTISLQKLDGTTNDQTVTALLSYIETARQMLDSLDAPGPADANGANGANGDNGDDSDQGGRGRGMRRGRQRGQEAQGIDREIIDTSIDSNVFATWYNLGEQLGGIADWETVPSDLDGIASTFLLPAMRKAHDRRLMQYWNDKINWETNQASKSTTPFAVNNFNQTQLPKLLWGRAEDMIIVGYRDQGLTQMYQIIKQYSNLPDAGGWIGELKNLLLNPASLPAVASAQPGD
ncbi:MAG: hypothetical protein ABSE62_14280 [Chthoniobacteraceae bacterium]|jgi:hypothetical protein